MELQTSDILLQLNCLELLSDLATAPHGLSYLDQRGTVRHLEEMIALSCESSKDGLLLSGECSLNLHSNYVIVIVVCMVNSSFVVVCTVDYRFFGLICCYCYMYG